MNISNILTIIRIAIIPIIVLCIYLTNPYFGWIAFILFCLAGITDYFDGYLARLRNEVTNFGTFLDPIADKLLVAAVILILTSKGCNKRLGYYSSPNNIIKRNNSIRFKGILSRDKN